MEKSITGFHRGEKGDTVAELGCGNTQHVRHNPPWQLRPWVITEKGHHSKPGSHLNCKEWDMQENGA